MSKKSLVKRFQNFRLIAHDTREANLLVEKLKKLNEHIRIEPHSKILLVARFIWKRDIGDAVYIQPEPVGDNSITMVKILGPVEIYPADKEIIYFLLSNTRYVIYYTYRFCLDF